MIREVLSRGDDCDRIEPLLSAHADGALDEADTAEVADHLAGCDACRQELDHMLALRILLGSTATPCRAPGHLADQLVAIAGSESDRELWLSGAGCGELPSARRRRRSLVAAGASLTTLAAAGTLTGAWLLGPGLREVRDPQDRSNQASISLFGGLDSSTMGGALTAAGLATGSIAQQAVAEVECPEHFHCPEQILGLGLVSVKVDSRTAPSRARLVYGRDGELTVVQQRGRWDGAGSSDANSRVWQSGDKVFCVTAEEPGESPLAAAEQELPHEPPAGEDLLDRLRAGLDALDGKRGG